jgi:hypothetical protein
VFLTGLAVFPSEIVRWACPLVSATSCVGCENAFDWTQRHPFSLKVISQDIRAAMWRGCDGSQAFIAADSSTSLNDSVGMKMACVTVDSLIRVVDD